jgi:hypothetical protein
MAGPTHGPFVQCRVAPCIADQQTRILLSEPLGHRTSAHEGCDRIVGVSDEEDLVLERSKTLGDRERTSIAFVRDRLVRPAAVHEVKEVLCVRPALLAHLLDRGRARISFSQTQLKKKKRGPD